MKTKVTTKIFQIESASKFRCFARSIIIMEGMWGYGGSIGEHRMVMGRTFVSVLIIKLVTEGNTQ